MPSPPAMNASTQEDASKAPSTSTEQTVPSAQSTLAEKFERGFCEGYNATVAAAKPPSNHPTSSPAYKPAPFSSSPSEPAPPQTTQATQTPTTSPTSPRDQTLDTVVKLAPSATELDRRSELRRDWLVTSEEDEKAVALRDAFKEQDRMRVAGNRGF